jgi:two-component system chemotaxis response regulator CheB
LTVGTDGRLSAFEGDRLNCARPSADVLLRGLAHHFGSRTLAVILTGRGNDGVRGCTLVREAGGTVVVQDPATCEAWGMPAAVHDAGQADMVVSLEAMARTITALVMLPGLAGHVLGERASAQPVASGVSADGSSSNPSARAT